MKKADEVSIWKLLVTALLALGCGFLVCNFQHIMAVSHVHISLAQSHRTTAFCAFAKCKLKQQLTPGSPLTLENTSTTAAPLTEASPLVNLDPHVSAETVQALTARVCGSPALDGYAHVDPKCLETSPTAKWWNDYYAKGHRQIELIAHVEKAADYDGLAVAWGIGNKMATAEDCAAACLKHMPGTIPGPFEKLPCNAFTWCPDEVCFEPDAHTHTKGDCWLKFTEGPVSAEINFRGDLPPEFRARHPKAPQTVQWWGGVLLPAGLQPTNGTFGPRWQW